MFRFSKERFLLVSILGVLSVAFFYLLMRAQALRPVAPSPHASSPPPPLQIDRPKAVPPPPSVDAPATPRVESLSERPVWARLNEKGLSLFNQGNYREALFAFNEALAAQPGEALLQRNVAQTHAELGWEANGAMNFVEAAPHFEEAIRHFNGEPTYFIGYGLSLHRTSREAKAVEALQAALKLNPKEATAYKILGEIYLNQNEFEKARSAWEKASQLDPDDRLLSIRLEKVRGESQLFSEFQSEATGHFTLLFDGREQRDRSRQVLDTLEEAYHEVGKAFSYYPEKTIFAVLYADQQFRDVTKTPAWTKALFDGKIHLPVGGSLQDERLLKKVIYHEYTHALVYQLSRGKTPTWLNEGLALFFEEPHHKGAPPLKSPLIPLEALHGSFMNYDASTAQQAYAESRSATAYLIDRYGLFRMKLLLERLATAPSFAETFEEIFLISYSDFQATWQRKMTEES